MKNAKRIFMLLVFVFMSTMLVALPGAASTATHAQDDPALQLHQAHITEARQHSLDKLSASVQEAMAAFEAQYPHFLKAVRKDQVPRDVLKAVWQAWRTKGNQSALTSFETRQIGVEQLITQVRSARGQDMKLMSNPYCEVYADIYYDGCRAGVGDAFVCFIAAERFLCVCHYGYEPLCDF